MADHDHRRPPAPAGRADPVTLVLPCLDEAVALPGVLARVPLDWRVIVVDNGSTDGSGDVARRCGAEVVSEPRRGYGAAVHAGLCAARTALVAVMDADGSIDPSDLLPLAATVQAGVVDLAVGRRRPSRAAWPVHARLGNAVLVAAVRFRTGLAVRDLAPVRVARRDDLLGLGILDRGCGYPLELLLRAGRRGWRVGEHDVAYRPRAVGTRSKISGTWRGSVRVIRDAGAVLRGGSAA